MINVTCAQCGLRILVPPTVQGRAGLCFGCGAQIHVPHESSEHVSDLTFKAGDRVADRYIVEAKIGAGGMGVVYKAQDTLIEEDVALKFMIPKVLQSQKGQQLFIREAQVARRLRHENIVAVHDVNTTTEGVLYLSMEYLKGASLRSFLRRHRIERKLVPVRLAVDVILKVLAALEYAHGYVIHRDLKPENIMLLPGEKVKVLDFGLAIAVQKETEEEHEGSSATKRITGTLAYAAPEQIRGLQVDYRADLYTVGLVFHELLTLRTPVDEPVTVMGVRQDVAPSIVKVLDKCLFDEPDRRWQTAQEFFDALDEAFEESYKIVSVIDPTTQDGAEVSTEDMVYLEGGSFLMGNNQVREHAPEFESFVNPFYIDKYPVTVEQYRCFMEATGYQEPKFWHDPDLNGPDQPVTGVTWEDAQAYSRWAGKFLPSERQWEFAARGKENNVYPWGKIEPTTARCNFGDYLGMPSIVNMHDDGATPTGIFDLSGNVHEWTIDGYAAYNPKNRGDNSKAKVPRKVVRGGSWHSKSIELVTSHRKGLFPETQLTTVGFRCVIPAKLVTR